MYSDSDLQSGRPITFRIRNRCYFLACSRCVICWS
ncbi:TRASH domain-containing protein [Nitrosomonas sp.]